MSKSNYYEILGVTPSASLDEIRIAFRTLAREVHPDRNPTPSAKERFILLREAYEILSDPEKAQEYRERIVNRVSTEDGMTLANQVFDELFVKWTEKDRNA